jgi:hypothetical protein
MAKYHNISPWIQIHFHLYFKCMSRGGWGRDPRVMGVTVCGGDSDGGELFYSALSRNMGEGMNDTTNGPRFGVPYNLCYCYREIGAYRSRRIKYSLWKPLRLVGRGGIPPIVLVLWSRCQREVNSLRPTGNSVELCLLNRRLVGTSAAVKNYIISLPCPSSNHMKRLCEDQPLVAAGQRVVLPSVTRALSLWLQILSISGCLSEFIPGANPHFFFSFGGYWPWGCI